RLTDGVAVVVASGEVLEAVEQPLTVQGLAVQVEHVVTQVVDTALDGVVAGEIGTGKRGVDAIRVDLVLVTVVVLTDEDAATRHINNDLGVFHESTVDLVEGLVGNLDLGGEAAGPVTEQL